jgi:DNA-binding transcriptional LysR family regulator
MTINQHWVRPYQSLKMPTVDFEENTREPIHCLEYAPGSYMSRVVKHCLRKAPFKDRLQIVYRASLAESILSATKKGLGVSWLPETVASGTAKEHGLRCLSSKWATPLSIRIYKSFKNNNPSVEKIWSVLQDRAHL